LDFVDQDRYHDHPASADQKAKQERDDTQYDGFLGHPAIPLNHAAISGSQQRNRKNAISEAQPMISAIA
jgi:hypothetical protein